MPQAKLTAADAERSTREGARKLAELAALLVEGYDLTQEQVAEKVGRSHPWVSGVPAVARSDRSFRAGVVASADSGEWSAHTRPVRGHGRAAPDN